MILRDPPPRRWLRALPSPLARRALPGGLTVEPRPPAFCGAVGSFHYPEGAGGAGHDPQS